MKSKDNYAIILAALRVHLNLKQEYVAKLMGMKQSMLSKIENGEKAITMCQFYTYAAILRLDPLIIMTFVTMGIQEKNSKVYRLLQRLKYRSPEEIIPQEQKEKEMELLLNHIQINKTEAENELIKLLAVLGFKKNQ